MPPRFGRRRLHLLMLLVASHLAVLIAAASAKSNSSSTLSAVRVARSFEHGSLDEQQQQQLYQHWPPPRRPPFLAGYGRFGPSSSYNSMVDGGGPVMRRARPFSNTEEPPPQQQQQQQTTASSQLSTIPAIDDLHCNSDDLRRILFHSIQPDSPKASKKTIHQAVSRELPGVWNVICAQCTFSFLARTTLYCQHTRYNVSCFVFREG